MSEEKAISLDEFSQLLEDTTEFLKKKMQNNNRPETHVFHRLVIKNKKGRAIINGLRITVSPPEDELPTLASLKGIGKKRDTPPPEGQESE